MASGLLDKANIILTPTGYKAGTMYNVAPIEQPYEDFVFSRASVASRVNSSGLVEMVGRTLGSNLVQNGDFSEIGPDLVQNGTFDLGSELVTNGDFSNGTTGWSSGNSTLSVVDGKLKVLATGAFSYARQNITVVSGKAYKITANFFYNSLVGNIEAYDGTTNILSEQLSEDGVITLYVTPSSTNLRLTLLNRNGSSGDFNYWDNVSVKEVPDWTLGTGWSVENNKAIYSGTANANLSQSGILTSSKQYKLEYEVISSTLVGGIVKLSGETASAQNVLSQSVGTHTLYFTADGTSPTDFNIRVVINTAGQYEITNIVVQELDPNDYWTLQNGWSLGDDEAVFTGTVSAYRKLYQTNFITIGNTYQLSFEITSITAGSIANLEPGSPSFDTVGVKTQTFVATFDDLYLEPTTNANLTISNVSVQEVIDTNNIPRISYDSNGENGHWLLEPTSTNEITFSEDFSQTIWTKNDVLVEGGYTAPDGSNTAYKVTNNGGNAHLVGYFNINTGKRKSIWAKTVSGTGDIDLLNVNGNNLFTLTNEWQRFDAAHIGPNFFYAVDFRGASATLSEVIVWGAQLEALSYATSYIPTLTGSTETRATETANGAGSADLINSTEGVLYAEIAALADDISGFRVLGISDGGSTNRIFIGYTSNNIYANVSSGTTIGSPYTPTNASNFHKVALKYENNNCKFFVDGSQIGSTTTSITIPSGMNSLQFDSGAGGSDFYGKVKALAVFNEALSDSELTQLTT